MSPICSVNEMEDGRLFQKIEDPLPLLPILKSRLPRSGPMVNQLMVYDDFKGNGKFSAYTFEDTSDEVDSENGHDEQDASSKLWILFNYKRDDWGNCVTISSPVPNSESISTRVKHALEHSFPFSWGEKFVLLNLDHNISDYLVTLNMRKFGNIIKIFPCYLFYMSPKDAANIEVPENSAVTVGPFDPVRGADFLMKNWDYATPETREYVLSTVPHHVSSAAYLPNGEIVCLAFAAPYGNVGCLVTHKDHRRKGYASLVLRYLYRELGKRGFHICLETALTNYAGIGLHTSITPDIVAKVDYVCHDTL